MNKSIKIGLPIGAIVLATGVLVWYVVAGQTNDESITATKDVATKSTVNATQPDVNTQLSTASSTESNTPKDTPTESTPGVYIGLTQYKETPEKYADATKIYFFHASWCSICQSIDKELTSSPGKIPANTVLIMTDFDSSTALRKQYGVTQQYTFVQFANDESMIKKWSATSASEVFSGIET